MAEALVLQVEKDNIVTLTLNRAEARNALNRPLLEELHRILVTLAPRRDLRAVILTGAGDKAFCAGADLRERLNMTDADVRAFVPLIRGTITDVERVGCPVIAALNGVAFGGGMEMALACDIRIAAQGAVMGLTETSLAIIPGAGGTQRLPRVVGLARAKELIYTARHLTADEALAWGIVNRVVPREQLMDAAHQMAAAIAKNGPIAVQQAKYAMDMGYGMPIDAGLAVEWKCYEQVLHTKDRVEGLRAFNEKRPPVYRGE
ncbi:MAG: enoyl-CoA hydratase/isomerase family protein [Deltaproteobacteria bacterium]|nr:enoyl-CoA hydratase/isomerase family protein [Deltaproteobacteria bacterium]